MKPLTAFYTNKRAPDGRRGDCKVCVLTARRTRYENDADALKARVAVYRSLHPEINQRRREADPEGYKRRNRRAQLRRYGLTQESYDQMFEAQGCVCAVCRSDDPGRYWAIDHDHTTGAVRGVLCWHCNVGMGHFRDDIVNLIAAADYLIRSQDTLEVARGESKSGHPRRTGTPRSAEVDH